VLYYVDSNALNNWQQVMLSCFLITCFSGPRPPRNRPIRLSR